MKLISVFNNKGGVGKTTLTFHLAHALAEMGHKTLLIDVDPQCNLTIECLDEEAIHKIWETEDAFIDDYGVARGKITPELFNAITNEPRTVHFLLKPVEDGVADIDVLPPPVVLSKNLALVPGRLTMHLYEDKLARRWNDLYGGDPLAIRTATGIRTLAKEYSNIFGYEFVIVDTSPSLGVLNKVVISTADGFLIPCAPDLFSVYGVRNIGKALGIWKKEFETIYQLLSDSKRASFPEDFVRLLGYTIYNARRYSGLSNRWNLAAGHLNYAKQLPRAIKTYVPATVRSAIEDKVMGEPIGGTAVMHSHNTAAAMAQKYHLPMWKVPDANLEPSDVSTIRGNRYSFEITQGAYKKFADELLERMEVL